MYKKFDIPIEIVAHACKKLLELSEIFIITKKGKVIEITDNTEIMLKTITSGKEILQQKQYYLENVFDFATTFIKPTAKYKTFNQKFVVYKYTILNGKLRNHKFYGTHKLPAYLQHFNNLINSQDFKEYIRVKKFERIIDDLDLD